jgi:uncharacterized protein (TIGR03067 family)
VDPSKSPKHFDATIIDGPAKGRTFGAIYELDGDTYQFCGSIRGKDRPAALTSEPGSGTMLQVLKREKQSVKDALNELARRELKGSWQAVAATIDGTKTAKVETSRRTLKFDAEGQVLVDENGHLTGATTVIDGASNPQTIDFASKNAGGESERKLAIFKVEDGRLTICLAAPGERRPKEFTSERGSRRRLTTYERIREAEPTKNR